MSAEPSPTSLQATVEQYDPHTGCGTAVTDAGVRWKYPGVALAPSIRQLRGGQRVVLHLAPDMTKPSPNQPTVISVTLLSVGAREG